MERLQKAKKLRENFDKLYILKKDFERASKNDGKFFNDKIMKIVLNNKKIISELKKEI